MTVKAGSSAGLFIRCPGCGAGNAQVLPRRRERPPAKEGDPVIREIRVRCPRHGEFWVRASQWLESMT